VEFLNTNLPIHKQAAELLEVNMVDELFINDYYFNNQFSEIRLQGQFEW
jgi:hypothetical protein